MYCVYHGRTQATGDERVVFIDKMGVDKNGILYVNGPTTTPKKGIQKEYKKIAQQRDIKCSKNKIL